jgi:uncharacterized protein (TIGR04255 family)
MMASRKKSIPKRLKHDAIVEAVVEIRFSTATIPEILFGRLADYEPWQNFKQQRLPVYEVPPPWRQADPNLRFLPIFELSGDHRSVRIGPHVISYHRSAPYVGWEQFRSELDETIRGLFDTAKGLVIRRLGLRYLNALNPDFHFIKSVSDLDLEIKVANESIPGNVNLNFNIDMPGDTACTVRIATKEFVQGILPLNTSVYVDVDVFTKEGFETEEQQVVRDWMTTAHESEKKQFFGLLTDRTIERLKEE